MNLRQLNYHKNNNVDYILKDITYKQDYEDLKLKLLTFNETYNFFHLSKANNIIVYDQDYYDKHIKGNTTKDPVLLICKIHQDCYRIHNNTYPNVLNIEHSLDEIINIIIGFKEDYGEF